MKQLVAILALLLALGSFYAADITPVATVNGEVITVQQLDEYARISYVLFTIKQTDQEFYNALLSTEQGVAFLKEYQRIRLQELVDRILLKQWANKAGISIDEEQVRQQVEEEVSSILQQSGIGKEEFEQYALLQGYESSDALKRSLVRDQLYRQYLIAVFSKVTAEATVSNEEIKQYYETNSAEFREPSKVHVLVLRTATEADAKRALEEISNGADFTEIAKRYSILDNTDGGWKEKSDFENTTAAEALFLAQKGAVVGPYEVSEGWEIYKLVDRVEERKLALEEAKDQIVSKLLDRKREELWNRWYNEEFKPFREQSKIEIGI
ncbi:MAG: hypothetical protein DRP27_01010 [Thermotogae bacterium]|nr:MAG: hypothetical protein DRP27_01010 [Thermotogota bacterium]